MSGSRYGYGAFSVCTTCMMVTCPETGLISRSHNELEVNGRVGEPRARAQKSSLKFPASQSHRWTNAKGDPVHRINKRPSRWLLIMKNLSSNGKYCAVMENICGNGVIMGERRIDTTDEGG